MRSNNTRFEKEVVLKLINHCDCSDKQVICDIVRSAFTSLDENIKNSDFVKSKLFFSFTAEKQLSEYGKGYQREIFCENVINGKSIAAGERYRYYKIIPAEEDGRVKKFATDGQYELDIAKYKESLWNCIEPIVETYGFDIKVLKEFIFG